MTTRETVTPDDLIAEHHRLDDFVKAENKRFAAHMAPTRARMEQIENQLLAVLNAQKLDKIASEHGTAYISTLLNLKVADREKFLDACMERWDSFGNEALLISAQKDAIKAWLDSHNGEPPPGIDISFFRRVNIRRS